MPGPGQYNLDSGRHLTPSYRIGTGKRSGGQEKLAGDLPGPGTFDVRYDWANLKKNAGFGKS